MAFPAPIRFPGLLGVQPSVSPVQPVGLPTREMFGAIQPVLQRTAAPTAAPASGGPSLLQRLLSGAGQVFGGMDQGALSPEQNAAARRQALVQAGLATIAAGSRPGASTLGALAQGAMFGQQAGEQARAQAYAATQEERVRQALEDPNITSRLTPQQLAMIRLMPPHQAAEMLAKLAFAPSTPQALAKGSILVDPSTGQTIAANVQPDSVEIPSELRGIAQLMGVDPNSLNALPPAQRAALLSVWENFRRAGATNVNVGAQGQTQKGMTETMLKEYDTTSNQATQAFNRLELLSVMDSLLEQGMTSGRLDQMLSPFRNVAVSLGVASEETAKNMSFQEVFIAIANKMAIESKEGMTGPMSDRDIEFLQKQVPQLANTPQGNKLMIEVMRRFARRQIELANEMDRYVAEKGNLIGWRAHKAQWLEQHPISLEDLYNRPAPFK